MGYLEEFDKERVNSEINHRDQDSTSVPENTDVQELPNKVMNFFFFWQIIIKFPQLRLTATE